MLLFHVDGFPPDILHDLLEGIVASELCLCIQDFIKKKSLILETLYHAIKEFPYPHSDKTNQPQTISKTCHLKGTIRGNDHGNWSLIRLLPLLIGHYIPKEDKAWEVLLCLKDMVELVMCTRFTEESLHFLDFKLSEHRTLLA